MNKWMKSKFLKSSLQYACFLGWLEDCLMDLCAVYTSEQHWCSLQHEHHQPPGPKVATVLLGKEARSDCKVYPRARPRQLEVPHSLPCAWNVPSAWICPRTQPWGSNVVTRSSGLSAWLNLLKAQLKPLYKLVKFGGWLQKFTCIAAIRINLVNHFPSLFVKSVTMNQSGVVCFPLWPLPTLPLCVGTCFKLYLGSSPWLLYALVWGTVHIILWQRSKTNGCFSGCLSMGNSAGHRCPTRGPTDGCPTKSRKLGKALRLEGHAVVCSLPGHLLWTYSALSTVLNILLTLTV